MKKIKRAHRSKRKGAKRLRIGIASIVLLVALGVAVWVVNPFNFRESSQNTATINYDPPGPENAQQIEDHKAELSQNDQVKEPDETTPPQGGAGTATPFITIAQQFNDDEFGDRAEVRAYVSGVVESGGTCRVTLTKGSHQITKVAEALPDVSTTTCGTIMIPRSEIPEAGVWDVVVTYTSESATGTSDATQLRIE